MGGWVRTGGGGGGGVHQKESHQRNQGLQTGNLVIAEIKCSQFSQSRLHQGVQPSSNLVVREHQLMNIAHSTEGVKVDTREGDQK